MAADDFYVTVMCDEDGDVYVRGWIRAELLEGLDRGILGRNTKFINDLRNNGDPQYWNGATLLIRGKVVVPRPVEVVKKWEVE